MPAIDLITLSREYGAGASALATALGARLGWRVLDEEIARTVAHRLGLPDDALIEWDEHAPTLLERVGQSLVLGSPDLMVDPAIARQPDATDVVRATRALLVESARTLPLIVVGHGAQSIFQGHAAALHIRLAASMEHRVRRICARRACSDRDAVALAHRMDADRALYVRRYYGKDVRDPLLYHLQINTGAIGVDESVALVMQLVEARRESSLSTADTKLGSSA